MTKNATSFKPGQSGNPGGRTTGTRRILTAAFIRAVAEDFQKHGPAVIEQVRLAKPDKYLEICARLVEPEQLDPKSGTITLRVVRYDAPEDDDDDSDAASMDAAATPDPGAEGARLRH